MEVDGDGDGDDATTVGDGRYRGMLSFQRLDVYRCAIEFVALAVATAAQILEEAPTCVTNCAGLRAAVLDILRTIGSIQELQHRQATDLLARVVAMLTKLCR